jgi:menaquinone-dependent protoporphyrinogen oxidase
VSDTVLVAYASRFGSTKEIAGRIGEALEAAGLAVEVRAADDVEAVDGYRAFVIGSTVEGGHWLKGASALLERHAATLGSHPLWLFSSGPVGDRAAGAPQPDPKEVAAARRSLRPRDCRVFGGSFDRATSDFSDMGLVERTVVRKFLPDGDWRDWPAIEAWATGIARQLAAPPIR